MGLCCSTESQKRFDRAIERQEKAVNQFNKTHGADYLRKQGYSTRQIKGFYRGVFHQNRQRNAYVLDKDAKIAMQLNF